MRIDLNNRKRVGIILKKSLIGVLSAAILLSTSTSFAFANDVNLIPVQSAKEDAVHFLSSYKVEYPQWKDIKNLNVGSEQLLYDFDGNLNAYLFPVNEGDVAHGYIIESAIPGHGGLLEAATAGVHPYSNLKSSESLYVGPSAYYQKLDKDNFVDLRTKSKINRKSLKSKGVFSKESLANSPSKSIQEQPPESTMEALATVTRRVPNVPDTPWHEGCVPTAAGNIALYWANEKGFTNLKNNLSGGTLTPNGMIEKLAIDMRTGIYPMGPGGTSPRMAQIGSVKYWSDRGYTLKSEGYTAYLNYQGEIINQRPAMINIKGDPTFGQDHTVTGYGYQVLDNGAKYALIRDSFHSVPTEVVYNWGQYVDGINTQVPDKY